MDLNKLVKSYVDRSPFYRRKYEGLTKLDFEALPFLTKKELLEDQRQTPPFGSNLSVERMALARVHRTSGTTRKPLLLALTLKDLEAVKRDGARAYKAAGVKPGDIIVNCMNYCMWMGGMMDHQSLEAAGAVVVPYGVGRTENLIELLLDFDKPSIHATPSYLNILKQVLKEKFDKQPRDLGLVKGFFGGESGMQDPAFRSQIEQEWGMVAMNANYGMSEAISVMGSECPRHAGLHFTAQDSLHVELIDSALKPVSLKAGARGEMVVTNLHKEAQPLIRYRTGDLIEVLGLDECSCGEKSFRFNVVGRADDMIVVRGINFFPESIRPLLAKYAEFTGLFTVLVPSSDPIDRIKILVETCGGKIDNALAAKLAEEISIRYFVKPMIELVEHLEVAENKVKLIRRVSNAEI